MSFARLKKPTYLMRFKQYCGILHDNVGLVLLEIDPFLLHILTPVVPRLVLSDIS